MYNRTQINNKEKRKRIEAELRMLQEIEGIPSPPKHIMIMTDTRNGMVTPPDNLIDYLKELGVDLKLVDGKMNGDEFRSIMSEHGMSPTINRHIIYFNEEKTY